MLEQLNEYIYISFYTLIFNDFETAAVMNHSRDMPSISPPPMILNKKTFGLSLAVSSVSVNENEKERKK